MKRLLLSTILLTLLLATSGFAQKFGKITGVVKEKDGGETWPGANVQIAATTWAPQATSKVDTLKWQNMLV